MKIPQSSYYQIGLGNKFLLRAKIIFLITLLFAIGLPAGAIYVGVSSGKIYKNFVEPLKTITQKFASSLEQATKATPTPAFSNIEFNISNSTSTSSSEVNVNDKKATNIKINASTSSKRTDIYPSQPTLPPQKSWEETVNEMNAKANRDYQDALKKQEEWSRQKKAENDAWFKQQTSDAQKAQDAWWATQQQQLEEWKKQHGF